jgi:hypothetical protein
VKRSKDRKDPPQAAGNALVDDAAKRLATIVAAAERAAEQVIDDAEARARQILADAEGEAARLRAALLEVVDRAARELDRTDGGAEREPENGARGAHLSAVPTAESDDPPALRPALAEDPDPAPGSAAGARLLATQMAVSGSSREEIEARLRNGFEIEDTSSILDAILGPED